LEINFVLLLLPRLPATGLPTTKLFFFQGGNRTFQCLWLYLKRTIRRIEQIVL